VQEIHLPAYEAAVREGGAGAAMCSYNRVNSVYACENPYLLSNVLKGQFGFTGFVMSDWSATHSTVASANAGLDMEMPGGPYFGPALKAAVQAGSVPMARLNDAVYRITYTMFRLGLFDHPPAVTGADVDTVNATTPTSLSTATDVAQGGTVLLKNAGDVLPLGKLGQRIAVIGQAATADGAARADQGYGSAHVPLLAYHDASAPLDAITQRAAQSGGVVTYADGTSTADAVAAAAADIAVVFVNDVSIESLDRPDYNAHTGTCSFASLMTGTSNTATCYYSPVDQNALVSVVAAANPHTVVVLQTGGPVAMPWANSVAGIVENWLPGQVDGDALAPILFGDVNPSGKLPVTFPVALTDGPLRTAQQYPGVTDAQGVPHATYSEGLLIGYRCYDAQNITPLFPFGYGLSYTTFAYSNLTVTRTSAGYAVTVNVTNTGHRAGADVAQLYVGDPSTTGEPPRQLKGFQKVNLLPGQTKTVTMQLDDRAFATWNSAKHTWTTTAGTYLLWVGNSSRNLPLKTTVKLPASG